MKVNFFFTWTKNKDRRSEEMKSVGGGFRFPNPLGFLKYIKRGRKR
ncbi:MAG: hypothetical protein UMV23_00995 [Halanaerobium sp.]|nr:hypothetical protein [Halanaerobium sp.]